MRSRYSAYALDDLDYLTETWHPDFRPAELSSDRRIRWLDLDIIATEVQDRRATVEFEARMLVLGQVEAMHERSEFVVSGGRWLYTSGELMASRFAPWKPGRNETCPCGSGRKFKRCCAVDSPR
jgi:SEC-C motif-containing protein